MNRDLQIAIVVQGRFHAFDLAKALAAKSGVKVHLLTNYSAKECSRFGLEKVILHSFWLHRFLQAIAYRLAPWFFPGWVEIMLHRLFGWWARRRLEALTPTPDVIRIFSGVAEEALLSKKLENSVRLVTRGSSHIRTQKKLLVEESARAGFQIDQPSDWMVKREEREYNLAHGVVVLSSFAQQSFLEEGYPQEKLLLIPNAVNLSWYGVTEEIQQAREKRLRSGEKLRILNVGRFSYQKGIFDLAEVVDKMGDAFDFRFVGDVPREGCSLASRLKGKMEFIDRVAPQELLKEYAWGDVFLFPTIQDGFPAVLSQALAAGLPAITTPNGSGPDVVRDGFNGWCVHIRSADQICTLLHQLNSEREELLTLSKNAAASVGSRTWETVAEDFLAQLRQNWPHLSFS